MSSPLHLLRTRSARTLVVAGLALAAAPVAAQASTVNLGTAAPFAVLGGSAVTNVGASVLNGDLGVSPGTSLTGFGPATVNGVTHANDATAASAQGSLTTAYGVAAGQFVPPGNNLTGIDLGGLTLTPGAYSYASSAQLTGALTLDAQGDPNAQFVFEIGTTLTTASASSVTVINGGSACNVFWQVGSSATLGSGTTFRGNVLALASITANSGATVTDGRLLASSGAVSLSNNVVTSSTCTAPVVPPPVVPVVPSGFAPTSPADTPVPAGEPTPDAAAAASPAAASPPGASPVPASKPAPKLPPASRATVPTRKGTAILRRSAPPAGDSARPSCTDGFRATVRGTQIRRVVFSLDGKRVASRTGSPYGVSVKARTGQHSVTARVTFKDATRAKTLTMAYRACSAAVLHPAPGPSQFTG